MISNNIMHKSYLPLPSPKKVGKSAYGKAYRALRKLVPVDENRRQAKQLHRREHGAADSPTPTPNKYYN